MKTVFTCLYIAIAALSMCASGSDVAGKSYFDWCATPDISLLQAHNFMEPESLKEPDDAADSGNLAIAKITSELLDEAHRHIGTRYRRGGKGPKGFDCSGFTGYVFKQFGFKLGASSRDQFLQGEAVDRDDIRPGDLLFFKGRSARSVGHVAIAIENSDGEISFIHAATSGGIRIDRVSQPYYSNRFLGARRVITPHQ